MAPPKYRELADELNEAIKAEATVLGVQLVNGAKLPTEPELAEHFHASRGTVRQALAGLAAAFVCSGIWLSLGLFILGIEGGVA